MSADSFDTLVQSWDDQQAAYITHREQRFGIMLDAIVHLLGTSNEFGEEGEGLTVLDLACGPGSLSQRILDRFPGIRVIGIDHDPVLLRIAGTWLEGRHPGRFTAVDADLSGDWAEALEATPIHVAVSSTALHWLAPHQLVAVYEGLGRLLPEDGLFLNGDHLRYDSRGQQFLAAGAAADDARTQRDAYARGVLTWDQWWEQAVSDPELAALYPERERRFADHPPTDDAPLELHLSALRTAGFRETGVLWQFWDDVVVLARR
ncbi:cyclopropane fatty-acyl-phospholipid synthase-like methyltransferase [Leucobacter luti]|uniref:Cyclopropane fatty-acyl-phospholipid synthase-like methyltransferase n=1 Tax=Leucobacter luti TaxID=340320 RepID=A0A4R6RYN1_9MICO|nr:class I SAM-dependent methyltransferase [Leucobacter luti]TDP91366.1 cyclopropane fatty-acyl-phospholipid synthase-like methyltransferase [Leucobacter luti]